MPQVVHLLEAPPDAVAVTTMRAQLEAGDRVIVVLLEGADAGAADVVTGSTILRVPADLDYGQLVDLVFESDQVIAW